MRKSSKQKEPVHGFWIARNNASVIASLGKDEAMSMSKLINGLVPSRVFQAFQVLLKPPKSRMHSPADRSSLGKARNFPERFREILSDPLNLLIERVPEAGYLNENMEVTLHNGVLVPIEGKYAYSGEFSEILTLNRGVHEPLEEYCFQEFLRLSDKTAPQSIMLELGAYWGHYSMWLKKELPNARCILVEPEAINLESGRENFARNGMEAEFINDFVSEQGFSIDNFLDTESIDNIYLLHSDIQGFEFDMLKNCKSALADGKIDYLMVSTHGGGVHKNCLKEIQKYDYVLEVISEPDQHSTSHDGFLFARRSDCKSIIGHSDTLGRVEIANASGSELVEYISNIHDQRR